MSVGSWLREGPASPVRVVIETAPHDSPSYSISLRNSIPDGWVMFGAQEVLSQVDRIAARDGSDLGEALSKCDVLLVVCNNNDHSVVSRLGARPELWQHIPRRALYLDDLHYLTDPGLTTYLSACHVVMNPYAYCAWFYTPMWPRFRWLPLSVPGLYRCEFNAQPIRKVLLSGSTSRHIYPLRHRLLRMSRHSPIEVIYSSQRQQLRGEDYIRELSKYWCCFTCCSNARTPYVVQKFFEIPYSGALLLAYDWHVREPLAALGFIHGVHYISCTPSTLEERVRYVLDPAHTAELDQIRLNGYRLVRDQHLMELRLRALISMTSDPSLTAYPFVPLRSPTQDEQAADPPLDQEATDPPLDQ